MWKKTIPAFVLIIILFLMGAFVFVKNKDKFSNNISENIQTSEQSEEETSEDVSEEKVSEEDTDSVEEKETIKFTISNQTFSLPIIYSDFIKTGFEIQDLRDADYCNGYQKIYYAICFNSEGKELPIDIENSSGSEKEIVDCFVDGITVTNNIPLLIDNSNVWENSLEQMEEKYGEISGEEAISDTETNYWWTFENGYTLLSTFKNKKCIEISFGRE